MMDMTASRAWRLGAAAVILSLAAACAGGSGKDIRPNEFHRAGAGLVCITLNEGPIVPGYLDCLRVGPVKIGDTAASIKRRFGKPYKVIPRRGATELVYPIPSKDNLLPYWVFTVKNRKVSAIQITGRLEPIGYAFSSLRLGDPEDKVRRILGPPTATEAINGVGAILWSYRPFPISMEIKDGRVYSMKIRQPKPAARSVPGYRRLQIRPKPRQQRDL